jgi:cellulose synthase/poly-beta-1,6-N-acetylglucosamine synthase-like glycosyltransferase
VITLVVMTPAVINPYFSRAFYDVEYFLIFYVAAINVIYSVLIVVGFFTLTRFSGRIFETELDTLVNSPMLPEIGVIAPAYNEELSVRESVRSMLRLRYPEHEVIVVNDGSKDGTLATLIDEFKLFRSSRTRTGTIPTKPVRGVYESREPIRLLVIDKENGGKADSLNAGINYCRYPLFAAVDSDSLIETDALFRVAKPFLDDPGMVASGGIVRVVNNCTVEHGAVTQVRAPDNLFARFQAVEYLRAFLGGRVAFSLLDSLLLISGAFGVFRRDVVLEVGGFETGTVGEDMELVVRLHRHMVESGRPYKIEFVPEPVCWTEVPESARVLKRQRNRWQRGSVETLWKHRCMFFNPKYGLVGMFGVPYFTFFEVLGPVVELLGYFMTVVGLIFRLILPRIALAFFLVSVLFGLVLSISSILLEEFTLRKYPSSKDVRILLWSAVIESLGFRQLTAVWRLQGLIDGIRGKQGWGKMERKGFRRS